MTKEILFHAGLPKTGTTSIQRTLYRNRWRLAKAGIFYPEPDTSDDPKHQFLVTGLLSGRHENFIAAINDSLSENSLLLSAEGLSNHLFDFPKDSLEAFRDILAPFRCRAVLVTRPWEDWLKSYFKQCVVNPPHERWTQYAFSGPLEAFANHDRVRPFSDMETLTAELVERLGIEAADTIEYSPGVLDEIIQWLPIQFQPESLTQLPEVENTSLSDVAAEVSRQLNGMLLDRQERGRWVRLIAELDGASNMIARSADKNGKKGDCRYSREVLRRLEWDPSSGLDVSPEAFDLFVTRMARKIGAGAE